ncbi:hypothetical protein [Leptospira kobayashii]|uniref:hypothetical protein n=1 Tax=Leptospira kobayashii TaxID=1917830 RepID=UPI000D58D630|nr:hypothetical protein [Leptospira kobayashii]
MTRYIFFFLFLLIFPGCIRLPSSNACDTTQTKFLSLILLKDILEDHSSLCWNKRNTSQTSTSSETKACNLSYTQIADAAHWEIVKKEMNLQIAKGVNGSEAVVQFSSSVTSVLGGSSSEAFQGGIASPNGKIYFLPYASSKYHELDSSTGIPNAFGSTPAYAASIGGSLGTGGKIYLAPHQDNVFRSINTNDNSIENYGTDTNLGIGSQAYSGSVSAPNGKIYFVPNSEPYVRYIDTKDNSIGRIATTVAGSFSAGVLASNGFIYLIPFGSNSVQYIDTKDDTIHSIGPTLPNANKYINATLAPNGKIYLTPYDETQFRYIDTNNNTVVDFETPLSSSPSGKFNGNVLAPNGRIYLIPYNNATFTYIDTANDTITNFGTNPNSPTNTTFRGGALASDGKIYLAPHNIDNYYYIDTKSVGSFCDSIRLSYYWNKQ